MSDHLNIEHNISRTTLANLQDKKLTSEGWSKQPCKACGGDGVVRYNGKASQCPSCLGAGMKWRPGIIVRGPGL